MKTQSLFFIILLISPPFFATLAYSAAANFDFFYFVLQWPGSICNSRRGCCYPSTGKPAAGFGIHGLWPNFNNGSHPSNCDRRSQYDKSMVSDLMPQMQRNWPTLACPSNDGTNFWTHEWTKHGTCAKQVLDQHAYFQNALNLKAKLNLLKVLTDARIMPNGRKYSLIEIKGAIKKATGHTPYIQCNVDKKGSSQLFQVYMCVDVYGTQFIKCPVFPRGKCASMISFPTF